MQNNAIVSVSAREALKCDFLPESYIVKTWSDPKHPYVPTAHENYALRREFVRDALAFLNKPDNDALYLVGPTGCGKTSGICEIAARLNWPTVSVTARGRMEASDMIGHYTLISEKPGAEPSMRFLYGPLAKAVHFGWIFILNEADLMDPSEISKLNDVLEGRDLIIDENGGQRIPVHPMFRFVATGNSAGCGDQTGAYAGVVTQNIAAMDRYRCVKVDYPDEEVEKTLILKVNPDIGEKISGQMVSVANDIRAQFMGTAAGAPRISAPMSTRTLIRWASLLNTFRFADRPIAYALGQAFTNRLPPEEAKAVDTICINRIGRDVWLKGKVSGRKAG